MSEAFKCDRCGTFGEGRGFAECTVRPRTEQGQTKFVRVVCETCASLVFKFIEGTCPGESHLHVLQTIAEMYDIPANERQLDMQVRVVETYQLIGGISNLHYQRMDGGA